MFDDLYYHTESSEDEYEPSENEYALDENVLLHQELDAHKTMDENVRMGSTEPTRHSITKSCDVTLKDIGKTEPEKAVPVWHPVPPTPPPPKHPI